MLRRGHRIQLPKQPVKARHGRFNRISSFRLNFASVFERTLGNATYLLKDFPDRGFQSLSAIQDTLLSVKLDPRRISFK